MSNKIEGIPDGWELEKVGQVSQGEHWINNHGQPQRWDSCHPSSSENYVIIRKIEKPKQYRPFANAAEFEPFRDRWVKYNGDNDCEENNVARVVEYSDVSASINQDTDTWKDHFDNYVFDDGTPFGIEVTE